MRKWILVGSTVLAIGSLFSVAANAEPNRVVFPDAIDRLEQFTTVQRGETEDILTTPEAIEAAKSGQPLPDGTHVVIRFHRDGEITRYFVMQKGAGWGADYDEARRTGDWQFQSYNADRSVKADENTARCQSCHQSRADDQYIFMFDQMKAHP